MIALVQRDTRPDRHLVADHHGLQQLSRRRIDELGDRQRSRDHDRARMSFGQPVAVVEIEHVGEHAVGEGGSDGAGAAAVGQQRRVGPGVHLGGVVGGDPGRRGGTAGGADRGHVGQQQREPIAGDGAQVADPEAGDELAECLIY